MAKTQPFVGRKSEMEQFDRVLRSPEGQVVLIVGQEGMGKSALMRRLSECAQSHPDLSCGVITYEVTSNDSPSGTMESLIQDAFRAANVKERSLDPTDRNLNMWRAFLNVLNVGDVIFALKRDVTINIRDALIERLKVVSQRMKPNQRCIIMIDPYEEMAKGSHEDWGMVGKDLPEKVKLVFAQRPYDCLITDRKFLSLENLVRVPEKPLSELNTGDVDKLVQAFDLPHTDGQLRSILQNYDGHPYAVSAALELVKHGLAISALPDDPSGIAKTQWDYASGLHEAVIPLFEAYAVLEVPVPYQTVEEVAGTNSNTRKFLLAKPYLDSLLSDPSVSDRRIYHSILSRHILKGIGETEVRQYHERAAKVYRAQLLNSTAPCPVAAQRLPYHVLPVEGSDKFVEAVELCMMALGNLGLWDTEITLLEKGLEYVKEDSIEKATLLSAKGTVLKNKGNFHQAVDTHKKALDILGKIREIDPPQGQRATLLEMATADSMNGLGLCLRRLGKAGEAEALLLSVLKMCQDRRLPPIDSAYTNLGILYLDAGNLQDAEAMFRKAIACLEELDSNAQRPIVKRDVIYHYLGGNYCNLANVYMQKGDLDQAEALYLKALQILQAIGNRPFVANIYINLGMIRTRQTRFGDAIEPLGAALRIKTDIGDQNGIADCHANLALAYGGSQETDEACRHILEARKIYEHLGLHHMVQEMDNTLFLLQLTRGIPKSEFSTE